MPWGQVYWDTPKAFHSFGLEPFGFLPTPGSIPRTSYDKIDGVVA